MDGQAQDSKRKYVADAPPPFDFSPIEPVQKKPKQIQSLSRVAKERFWRLPVELKDIVSANLDKQDLKTRFEVASLMKQPAGLPVNASDAADYFLRSLYHAVEFPLDPQSLETLKGLLGGPTLYNFSLIRSVLFDSFESTQRYGLERLLDKFPSENPNLRIASFTMESSIRFETLPVLEQFYQQNSASLEVIVVPKWNDGDVKNITTLYRDEAATAHLTRRWTLLDTRTTNQVKQIDCHNIIATPGGLPVNHMYHEPRILQQTGLFDLSVSLARKRVTADNAPGHHSEKLDVLAHYYAPVCLYRSLVAEVNGYKVRGFSMFADPPHELSPAPPLGPVAAGMGWPKTIALEKLRLSFIECTVYCRGLLSQDPEEVPKTFSFGSLKLLQLNGCVGNAKFLDGLHKHSIHIETFLFSVHDEFITSDEEEAIVQLVRSSGSLRQLSLAYRTPPVKPRRLRAAFAVLTDYPDAADDETNDLEPLPNAHRYQSEASDSPQLPEPSYSISEFCRFPLARLFGPVNYTIRSLALAQSLRSARVNDDLAYIGATCSYLTDLAITYPLIEMAVIHTFLDASMKQDLEDLADVLQTYPHLKYLQLVARGDERDIYASSPLEHITRQVISILLGRGLQIDFFTVALRSIMYKYEMGAETCHLRVRSDPKLSETVSETALKREMEVFGDTALCASEHLVTSKKGFMYDYDER